jgi:hypothetical protein
MQSVVGTQLENKRNKIKKLTSIDTLEAQTMKRKISTPLLIFKDNNNNGGNGASTTTA